MNHLPRIRDRYRRICEALGVRSTLHAAPQHDGSAHAEFLDGRYHYVVTERGSEFERRVATDEDEILYWLASDLVFGLACDFELRNRLKGQDVRRLLFAKELELLGLLNSAWVERKREEIERILQTNPYSDATGA